MSFGVMGLRKAVLLVQQESDRRRRMTVEVTPMKVVLNQLPAKRKSNVVRTKN